jgi:hypothetical protein
LVSVFVAGITADWQASAHDKWVVPFGGGIGRLVKIDKRPINARIQAFYNVVKPTVGPPTGPTWTLRSSSHSCSPAGIDSRDDGTRSRLPLPQTHFELGTPSPNDSGTHQGASQPAYCQARRNVGLGQSPSDRPASRTRLMRQEVAVGATGRMRQERILAGRNGSRAVMREAITRRSG